MLKKILALLIFTCSVSTQAAIINLTASMDGNQANAGLGTGSPGTGTAAMTLDDQSGLFSWTVQWSGLIGQVTVAHFHGPAGPDANAGVQVGIDAMSNPSVGNAVINAQQQADLVAGLWYVNIHSTRDPGGEIRGQVNMVPLPAAAWLFGSALLALAGMNRGRPWA